jgi:hypothetical protein
VEEVVHLGGHHREVALIDSNQMIASEKTMVTIRDAAASIIVAVTEATNKTLSEEITNKVEVDSTIILGIRVHDRAHHKCSLIVH